MTSFESVTQLPSTTRAPSGAQPAERVGSARWRLPRPRPHHLALAAILAVACVLYVWAIGANGFWGNQYYAAAVKTMSQDAKAFLFGGYDGAGVVTVDKPPLPLWPQVLSVWVFGYHSWALLLPQAIEGVATVFVLHRTVRRWAGEAAALLAAAVLAVTPITVAINRDNNPDTLLMLFLVSAAYAATRAFAADGVGAARTRWLLLAAFLIGCGFNTKMMQAWTVVPAFAAAYLFVAGVPVRRKLLDLLAAGSVLLASSLWWVVLTSVWPWSKPFIGGSPSGSAWNLIIGYNGFGRIIGNNNTTNSQGASAKLLTGLLGEIFGGATGPTRLFDRLLGGQITWLMPGALLILVAVAVARFRGVAGRPPGWVLWGTWLVVLSVVLSFAKGMFHPYYTTTLAPAIAALVGAGMVTAWAWWRDEPRGWRAGLLPLVVAVSAAWAWVLVSRDLSWNGWLRYAVAAVALLALVGLGVAALTKRAVPARAGFGLGLVACLLGPAVWSATTGFGPSHAFLGAGNVSAGPYVLPPYFDRFGPQSAQETRRALSRLGGNSFSNVTLNPTQRRMLAYVKANAGTPIELGIEGGAVWGSRYVVSSDVRVVAFGGYAAGDPVPTTEQLADWVDRGRMRFVLSSSPTVAGIPQPDPFAGGPAPTGSAADAAHLIFAPLGGEPEASRIDWVHGHCVVVPPAQYGVTDAKAVAATAIGFNTLFDCRPRG